MGHNQIIDCGTAAPSYEDSVRLDRGRALAGWRTNEDPP